MTHTNPRRAPIISELVTDEVVAAAVHDRWAPDPACPVLRPAARREPLDITPVWTDSRAHRATRVASDVIAGPQPEWGQCASAVEAEEVSLNRWVEVPIQKRGRAREASREWLASHRAGPDDRADRRDGRLRGSRHGGGNRSISQIPNQMRTRLPARRRPARGACRRRCSRDRPGTSSAPRYRRGSCPCRKSNRTHGEGDAH